MVLHLLGLLNIWWDDANDEDEMMTMTTFFRLCNRHCSKCFSYINSSTSHNNPKRKILFSHIWRWENKRFTYRDHRTSKWWSQDLYPDSQLQSLYSSSLSHTVCQHRHILFFISSRDSQTSWGPPMDNLWVLVSKLSLSAKWSLISLLPPSFWGSIQWL